MHHENLKLDFLNFDIPCLQFLEIRLSVVAFLYEAKCSNENEQY